MKVFLLSVMLVGPTFVTGSQSAVMVHTYYNIELCCTMMATLKVYDIRFRNNSCQKQNAFACYLMELVGGRQGRGLIMT